MGEREKVEGILRAQKASYRKSPYLLVVLLLSMRFRSLSQKATHSGILSELSAIVAGPLFMSARFSSTMASQSERPNRM